MCSKRQEHDNAAYDIVNTKIVNTQSRKNNSARIQRHDHCEYCPDIQEQCILAMRLLLDTGCIMMDYVYLHLSRQRFFVLPNIRFSMKSRLPAVNSFTRLSFSSEIMGLITLSNTASMVSHDSNRVMNSCRFPDTG